MSQTLQTTDAEEDFIWAMLQDTRTQIAFSPQIEKDQCCDKEGSQLVDNFSECLDAFINLQIPYTTWGGKISDPTRPGGCILDVRTDVVRFNTNFEHKQVRGLDEPLCKRGENTFTTEFTPIAEINGYVMGARGQGCPDQQVIVQEKDCAYALRMFTRFRPDGATVDQSLKDDINYPVGCTLNFGREGIYNDFHAFADNAEHTFKFGPNSYPVCYKEGVRIQNSIAPKNRYHEEDCHVFQKNFDHDDCPRGFRLHRLDRCGFLGTGNRPVCVRTEFVCAKGGDRVDLREVNGKQGFLCLGRTNFGENNQWRPTQSQSQIPCDSPSCASKLQCAREQESCSCQGTVRYGWGTRWRSHEVDGSIKCNNGAFGDPYPGQQKICTCDESEFVGYDAKNRRKRDTGSGMQFISEYTFSSDGILNLWELFSFRDTRMILQVWRESSSLKFHMVARSIVDVTVGFNQIKANIEVRRGDVIGWYGVGIQPIEYDNGGARVRRVSGFDGLTSPISMTGHKNGWSRSYSIRAAYEVSTTRRGLDSTEQQVVGQKVTQRLPRRKL